MRERRTHGSVRGLRREPLVYSTSQNQGHWGCREGNKLENKNIFGAGAGDELIKLLEDKLSENGKSDAYMSCDFGRIRYRDAGQYNEILQTLAQRQREYIEGLPWKFSRCYHKLDERMTGILLCLCRQEMYRGAVYFLGLEECVEIA